MHKDAFEALLKELGRHRRRPAVAKCPDSDQFAAWLDGTLPPDQSEQVVGHVADCPECRSLAIAVAGDQMTPSGQAVVNPDGQTASADTAAKLAAELSAMEKMLGLDAPEKTPCRRPLIMAVDDDPIYLSALTDTLSREYDVTACTSGREALERIHAGVNAVVLDIKMAGLDGLEVAEGLNLRHVKAPVIFNTGYPGEYVREDIERRFAPFGYVTKDDPGLLLSRLRQATRQATGAQGFAC